MISGVFVGLTTIDIIYTVDEVPDANTKIVAHSQQLLTGGPTTNAAITFSHLGGSATLVSCVGRHPLGVVAKEELRQYSVDLIDLKPDSPVPPPLSSVYVDRHGQRSVVSINTTLSEFPQPQINPSILNRARILLVDGHAMQACQAWAQAARSSNIPVIFDGGSWKPGTEELLKQIDIAICSADFSPPGCPEESTSVEYLRSRGVKQIAITRGADPVRFVSGSSDGFIEVPKIEAVDTTGAGDIFHGAFCFYFSEGHDFTLALRKAASIAAESCRFPGTRQWMQLR